MTAALLVVCGFGACQSQKNIAKLKASLENQQKEIDRLNAEIEKNRFDVEALHNNIMRVRSQIGMEELLYGAPNNTSRRELKD